MPNRLADESSPYLLQHASNPVDWYPWSSEAIDRARSEEKPVFLSIGYSACHWCHVMEHESFEDQGIADLMNRDFVCIKVDREERPDLDQIYMTAVQILTGRGGWPMSVFLTPELQPFFGGTYWPPEPRLGMPGFRQVLAAVVDAWTHRRDQTVTQAAELTKRIRSVGVAGKTDEFALAHASLLTDSAGQMARSFDLTHGGFGAAPKFPHAMNLQYLLRAWHRTGREDLRDFVRLNLDKMAAGGIYDHLAGGFARYSVDEKWLVPHFEKMLYDNGLLASTYLDGFLATDDRRYADVARETLDYILTYMTDKQGGFHSTEDADSEGVEGKFYVWSREEIEEILGEESAEQFCCVYDVTAEGNFEGKNILNMPRSLKEWAAAKSWDAADLSIRLRKARSKILKIRDERVRPAKDDKVLVSWNGLMIDAMARGGRILGDSRYVDAAAAASRFILREMQGEDGRLMHCWRNGRARHDGFLDDYACLANGLVTLYEVTFDESWIDEAMRLVKIIRQRFADPNGNGFFFTSDDQEQLISRQKDLHDSSVPSANAMTATVLTRLGKLCGRADFLTDARGILDLAAEIMERSPLAAGQLLIALDMHIGPFPEIAILGDPSDSSTSMALDAFWTRFIPNRVIACRSEAEASDGSICLDAIFLGREPLYGTPSIYVCNKFTCDDPVSGKEAAIGKWGELVAMGRTSPR